nr:choice-of-anchor D domain-containing protein [Roseibium litorale]
MKLGGSPSCDQVYTGSEEIVVISEVYNSTNIKYNITLGSGVTVSFSGNGSEVTPTDYSCPTASSCSVTVSGTANSQTYSFTITRPAGSTNSTIASVEYGAANAAPVADAGTDQAVTSGTQVTLDGSGSSDSDGTIVSYAWTRTGGTGTAGNAVLSSASAASPTFTDSSLTSNDTAVTHIFSLVVTDDDGAASTADTVTITINPPANAAPVADAGTDQAVTSGTQVTLDGSGSSDSDGTIASYAWTRTGGTGTAGNAVLSSASAASPTFTDSSLTSNDTAVTHIFSLVVTDDDGAASTADTVTITINPPASLAPEIAVSASIGGAVTDGGTNAQGTQTAGTAVTVTYTVTNSGTGALTLGTASVTGTPSNVSVGTIGAPASTTVAAGGGTTTFTVQYTPTIAGAFSFDLSFTNNDSDENPFNFTVSGTASGAPEIEVSSSEGGAVSDGGTNALSGTKTASTPATVTYTITNSGLGDLTITTPTVASNISGQSNVTVNSLTLGAATVAANGGTTTLTVAYTPTIAGAFSFDLSLTNTDSDESPFDITVSGTASGTPEIEVSSSDGGAVADGGTNTLTGTKSAGAVSTLTYTITNTGTDSLVLTAPTVASNISGQSNVTVNSLTLDTSTVAASGGTATLTVSYTPTVSGSFSFDLSLTNNDSDENPFNVTVSGTAGALPEIGLSGSEGGAVASGGTTVLSTARTAGTASTVTYTVSNTGLAPLTLTSPSVAANVSAQSNVAVTGLMLGAATVTAGGSTTLTVTFTPEL